MNGEIYDLTEKSVYRESHDENKWIKNDNVGLIKRRILIRNIVDFIAGMTDGYAIEEYERLK